MSDETRETPEPISQTLSERVKAAPMSVTAATILAVLFGSAQGLSAVQNALDSRYTKREDSARQEEQYKAILDRLDRIEKKFDKSQGGQ